MTGNPLKEFKLRHQTVIGVVQKTKDVAQIRGQFIGLLQPSENESENRPLIYFRLSSKLLAQMPT